MLKNISKIIIVFIVGIVGGIFSDQIFWPYFIERPLFLEYRLEQNPVYITETKEITIQENIALENAIEKTEKVVVGIQTKTSKGKILRGSGLIVTSDGLILALAELFPKNSSITIYIEGVPYHSSLKNGDVKILKKDLDSNFCLIKVEANNLNTAGFFDFDKIKLGQRVFSIGNMFDTTFTKETAPKLAVNQGIVKYFDDDFIYTDIIERETATGNPCLGSPLFSIDAQVIGINFIDKQGNLITIPSSTLRNFIGF
jgi:S1-C subfamily serine protease